MKSKSNYNGLKSKVSFISKIISWTLLVLLVLLALFLAYYTIGNRLAEQNDGKFEPIVSLYTIVSPSMTPNINVGDVVVTRKVKNSNEIKVGDVITFVSTSSISKGMIITHRVIEIGKDELGVTYKTKGDNNLSPDTSPAQYNNVIGKVVLRIPKLGHLQGLLANQGGWLLLIVIPALFIIVSDIVKIFKLANVKNKIEKIDETEKKFKREKQKREEIRKEELKKKLKIEKNINEPEPIRIKKNVRIVVAENKMIKIKETNKVNNKNNNKTKSKRNRNRR